MIELSDLAHWVLLALIGYAALQGGRTRYILRDGRSIESVFLDAGAFPNADLAKLPTTGLPGSQGLHFYE